MIGVHNAEKCLNFDNYNEYFNWFVLLRKALQIYPIIRCEAKKITNETETRFLMELRLNRVRRLAQILKKM